MSETKSATQSEHFKLTDQLAEKSLHLYHCSDKTSYRLLNYSENTTYLLEDPVYQKKTILRINRPGYHSKEGLMSEMMWLQDIIRNSSIIVPKPIRGLNGELVQELKLDIDGPVHHCTMFTYLMGSQPDEENQEEMAASFHQLGEITAELHDHTRKWPLANKLNRFTWDYHTTIGNNPRWGRWQNGMDVTKEITNLLQAASEIIFNRLNHFGSVPDRFGLIHADLRLANLLVEHDQVKVIDFDDCGYGYYLYDIAAALSYIEHKSYVPELVQSWLDGYRKKRYLSKEEEAEIPTFIMLRRMLLVAWLGTRSDSDTAKAFGSEFTNQTVEMAENYLLKYS